MLLRFTWLTLLCMGCMAPMKEPLPADLGIDVETDSAADGSGPFQGELTICADDATGELTTSDGVHFYRFESRGCSDARLELGSFDGQDVLLVLYEPLAGGWVELTRNDDCDGDATESCIRRALPPGEFVAAVTTHSRLSAGIDVATRYELNVRCFDEFACNDSVCDTNAECGPGRFCDFAVESACGDSAGGRCAVLPDECPPEFDQVCGCDGMTYANACAANARGMSIASDSACDVGEGGAEGAACEGGEFPGCQNGLFCDFSSNPSCDVAPGVCARDEAVFCPDVHEPVCGCDGRTYGNSCLRRNAGVAADHSGEC